MSSTPTVRTNLPDIGKKIASKANRDGVAARVPDPAVQKRIDVDLALLGHDDHLLRAVALSVLTTAQQHNAHTRSLRRTVPGSGEMLSLVLLDDIHALERFPRVQAFVSYCRLVTGAQASAGKRYGTSGTKLGHADLTWAFSEAAGLCLRNHPAGQQYLARLENKHGQGKALTVLAHTLARAVYDLLKRGVACDRNAFLQREGRGVGEPAASLGHDGRAWQPCAASRHPVRRRTPMSTSALGPDPARVMGRLLPLLDWSRTSLMVTVCCPSPDPEPHWRMQMCSPWFASGGLRVQRSF